MNSTPAPARLRDAGDALEGILRAACPAGLADWRAMAGGGRPSTVERQRSGRQQPAVVAYVPTPELAAYLSVWSPVTGLLIAQLLRTVAALAESHDVLVTGDQVRRPVEKLLAGAEELSRRIPWSTDEYTTVSLFPW